MPFSKRARLQKCWLKKKKNIITKNRKINSSCIEELSNQYGNLHEWEINLSCIKPQKRKTDRGGGGWQDRYVGFISQRTQNSTHYNPETWKFLVNFQEEKKTKQRNSSYSVIFNLMVHNMLWVSDESYVPFSRKTHTHKTHNCWEFSF